METIASLFERYLSLIADIGLRRKSAHFPLRAMHLTNLFACNLAVVMFLTAIAGAVLGISPLFLTIIRLTLVPIYAMPLVLNYWGINRSARFYLTVSPPLMLLVIAWLGGIPDPISLKAAMLPAVLLPIVLYGLEEIRGVILGTLFMFVSLHCIEVVPQWGGFFTLTATVFTNTPELRLNGIVNIVLTVAAFLFYQVLLMRSEKEILRERERADALLENILPREIIPILKRRPSVIANHFEGTSILFADIVGFTSQATTMAPRELVNMLNEVFSYFDSLVDKYGLEKIKTIGDCYMAAAGVPKPREDHASALVDMALEAQEYIQNNLFNKEKLTLRVGIASGPVIAGVIGQKKFIYDLWGDTVNIASRMESHGEAGSIQITEETLALLDSSFITRKLGDIAVKGKGIMPIYQVTGKAKLK